jgi:hypothetical protein
LSTEDLFGRGPLFIKFRLLVTERLLWRAIVARKLGAGTIGGSAIGGRNIRPASVARTGVATAVFIAWPVRPTVIEGAVFGTAAVLAPVVRAAPIGPRPSVGTTVHVGAAAIKVAIIRSAPSRAPWSPVRTKRTRAAAPSAALRLKTAATRGRSTKLVTPIGATEVATWTTLSVRPPIAAKLVNLVFELCDFFTQLLQQPNHVIRAATWVKVAGQASVSRTAIRHFGTETTTGLTRPTVRAKIAGPPSVTGTWAKIRTPTRRSVRAPTIASIVVPSIGPAATIRWWIAVARLQGDFFLFRGDARPRIHGGLTGIRRTA